MNHDVIALPAMIEKHMRLGGARPHSRFTYKGLDVFLGEGGPHFDTRGVTQLSDMDAWMHDGYYLSVYFIQKGRQVLGQPLYFTIDHDLDKTDRGRLDVRIAAAEAQAKQWIEDGIKAGHYDPMAN